MKEALIFSLLYPAREDRHIPLHVTKKNLDRRMRVKIRICLATAYRLIPKQLLLDNPVFGICKRHKLLDGGETFLVLQMNQRILQRSLCCRITLIDIEPRSVTSLQGIIFPNHLGRDVDRTRSVRKKPYIFLAGFFLCKSNI